MAMSIQQDNLTRQERLDFLKIEISLLQEWFNKYDELIFRLRGWLMTIFVAVLGLMLNQKVTKLTGLLIGVAIFFYLFEMLWLYWYWSKRSLRFKEIRRALNSNLEELMCVPIFDFTYNYSRTNKSSQRFFMAIKSIEPIIFYSGLAVGTLLVNRGI